MSAKKKSSPVWWILLLALVAGGWVAYSTGIFKKEQKQKLVGATVQRGPLKISVVQRGNIAAKDAVSIKSEIEGQSTILFLIPEGTLVKPGDLLVDLDAADLKDRKVAQDIAVQNADAAYVKATAQRDIQVSQNKSDIELAERKRDFAITDLKKYLEGDRDQIVKQADEKITLALAEKSKSGDTLVWSKELAERKFLTTTELVVDQLDFDRAKIQLEQAERAKHLLEKYDDPRKRQELEANVKEGERGFERAALQATARIVDYESGVSTSKSKLDLEKEKLQKYLDQIQKCRVVSKDSGLVVYTRQEGGRMGGGEPVQEGTQVRERQEILTIPRTGDLIAEASIHESVLKQVGVGMPCKVQVDAIPGLEFDARVQFVALFPDKASWWANPNQRLYKTQVSITKTHPDMRPGMSCSVEILSEEIADCTFVALQAVTLHQGDTIAFVAQGEEYQQRKVKVGRSNDKWVEIVEGLAPGETVLLAPPPGFTPIATDKEKVNPDGVAAKEGAPMAAGARGAGGMPGAGAMPGENGASGGERRMPGAGNRGGGAAGGATGEGGAPGAQRGGGRRPDGAGGPAGGAPAGGTPSGEAPKDAVPAEPKKTEAAPAPKGTAKSTTLTTSTGSTRG